MEQNDFAVAGVLTLIYIYFKKIMFHSIYQI